MFRKQIATIAIGLAFVCLLTPAAGHASTMTVFVPGTAGPWDAALNPSFPYTSSHSGQTSPITINLVSGPSPITVSYLSGDSTNFNRYQHKWTMG